MQDIDYGQILEALNDKTDRDLGNLSVEGRVAGGGLAFPSSKFDSLTPGASGSSYLPPANGELWVIGNATGDSCWLAIKEGDYTLNSYNFPFRNANGYGVCFRFQVKANVAYTITFNQFGFNNFIFVYAEGSNN